MTRYQQPLLLLLIVLAISSCVKHDELLNFTQGEEFSQLPPDIDNIPTLKIQPDDLMSIRVLALDLEAVIPFNIDQPNTTPNLNTGGMRPLIGYLVNSEGTIDFPILGKIQAAGKTTEELKLDLIERLKPYLKEPVVVVRYLNFRVTVLGEVFRPGTLLFPNERVTVLDAIGQAGDLTPYGNRTNVLIVREQEGQRNFSQLNLQDRHIFESPYFYLQQNDVIYVEPLEAKTSTVRDQTQRILPWLSVITSLTTLVITLTRL
ncbi:MAG: polysaccharide biosynthesis/export family protein [Bacteroidota bacterium]